MTEMTPALCAFVRRIAGRLRIPAEHRDDCIQAGYMACLTAIPQWDKATPWEAFVAGSLKLSVSRDMLRELERNTEGGVETVPVEDAEWLEDEEMVDDESGHLPTMNEGNEDLDSSVLREQLIDGILALQNPTARKLFLGVLEGRTVSAMGVALGLTQSTADRLYQRTVVELRTSLSRG